MICNQLTHDSAERHGRQHVVVRIVLSGASANDSAPSDARQFRHERSVGSVALFIIAGERVVNAVPMVAGLHSHRHDRAAKVLPITWLGPCGESRLE